MGLAALGWSPSRFAEYGDEIGRVGAELDSNPVHHSVW